MRTSDPSERKASCACGRVELAALGHAITSVVCHCDDCGEGSRRIEALPNARRVRDAEGGTAYVVYRREAIRCTRGDALLEPHKLRAGSPTSRYVATCCNSAMYLAFDDAKPWVNLYRARLHGEAPALQMRLSSRFTRGAASADADGPSSSKYSVAFVAKLLSRDVSALYR
jgi:hypothetical protein